MPITFEIHADQGYFVSTWRGEILDADLQSSYDALLRNEKYKPGYHEITDVRDADMKCVTGDGLRELSLMVRQRLGDDCIGFKTAIVAPEDLIFGLSRIYEVYSSDSPESVSVFREIVEALAWINME